MKNFKVIFSLILVTLALSLVSVTICGQEKIVEQKMQSGNNLTVATKKYTEIPEATEPCEPVVCEWWSKLRQAANDLQRKEDNKSKKKCFMHPAI